MRAATILLLGSIGSFCPPSPASSFLTHHRPVTAPAAIAIATTNAIRSGCGDDILILPTATTTNTNTGRDPSSHRRCGIVESNEYDDGIAALDDLLAVGTSSTATTRRSFGLGLAIARMSILGYMSSSTRANASGGATAGGAYLLSAKQRYNKRVLAGIKSFLTLDARNLGEVNAFLASSEEGGWEDLSAAGYLLSNAFRTSSTKAPDALPSVKKWKAFAKEIELLKLASTKKNAEKVLASYASALEKLDDYLAAVELPSGMELRQM